MERKFGKVKRIKPSDARMAGIWLAPEVEVTGGRDRLGG